MSLFPFYPELSHTMHAQKTMPLKLPTFHKMHAQKTILLKPPTFHAMLAQKIVHSPSCPTVTFQPAYGVAGGPGLVPMFDNNKSTPLYFCQSSQPIWSAHRDPSFGHAILEMLSDKSMKLSWWVTPIYIYEA